MKTGFYTKPIEVGILADRVALGPAFCLEISKRNKCRLNFHKIQICAVKVNKFRSGL